MCQRGQLGKYTNPHAYFVQCFSYVSIYSKTILLPQILIKFKILWAEYLIIIVWSDEMKIPNFQ